MRREIFGTIFGTALALAAAAFAPAADALQPRRPAGPVTEAMRELSEGRYMAAVTRLRAVAASEGNPMAGSLLSQIEPFVTGMPARPQGRPRPVDAGFKARLARSTARPAIKEIVERARRTNIVILNEAHDTPAHRAFALEVARALRPLGYDILAMEAFRNPPDAAESNAANAVLARRGHALRSTGFYTAEPVFADLIRQSLAMGYRPVAYEHSGPGAGGSMEDQIARREQGQAENLVGRIFARDRTARVLIHVGYSHAAEAPLPQGGGRMEWMAARLKRMTGIDPLTIDQTGLTEFSPSPVLRGQYGAAAARIGSRSGILIEEGRPLVVGPYEGAVDIQVVHPPTRLIQGRPDWLRRMGRTPVPIPAHLLPANGERLIQAFVRSEGPDAIPIDQVLVRAGEPAPVLMLPNLPVRFAYQDGIAAAQPGSATAGSE